MTIQLGDRVKDKISGFSGIITVRADYLFGSVMFCVQPEAMKDCKPIDGEWYDEGQLVVVDSGVIYDAPTGDNLG